MSADRIQAAFDENVANLREAVAIYKQCEPLDLATRWRRAKSIVAPLAVLALNRGRNHRSLIHELGLGDTIAIPTMATSRPSVHGIALVSFLSPAGETEGVLVGKDRVVGMPRISLSEWAGQTIYAVSPHQLSRGDVLWTVRDKEGVAHFDANIESLSGYNALLRDPSDAIYYRRHSAQTGFCLFVGEARLHIVKELPPPLSAPPDLDDERVPLRGAVDGTLYACGVELLAGIDELLAARRTG